MLSTTELSQHSRKTPTQTACLWHIIASANSRTVSFAAARIGIICYLAADWFALCCAYLPWLEQIFQRTTEKAATGTTTEKTVASSGGRKTGAKIAQIGAVRTTASNPNPTPVTQSRNFGAAPLTLLSPINSESGGLCGLMFIGDLFPQLSRR